MAQSLVVQDRSGGELADLQDRSETTFVPRANSDVKEFFRLDLPRFQLKRRLLDPYHSDDYVEWFDLEPDLYSLCVIRDCPELFCCIPVPYVLPTFTAICQVTFLWIVSLDGSNIFFDGQYIMPVSEHAKVNVMKVLCMCYAIGSIYAELQHCVTLWAAVRFGDFEWSFGSAANRRRWLGYWAVAHQYLTACIVTVAAVSLVTAGTSALGCIFKTLSAGLSCNVDNVLGKFIRAYFNCDFTMRGDKASLSLKSGGNKRKSVELETVQSCSETCPIFCFMTFPLLLFFATLCFQARTSTLLATLIKVRHLVSNDKAPEFTVDVGGCCNIVENSSHASYEVMFFAPAGEPPPVVYWVALHANKEAAAPNAFCVMAGTDGEGNNAFRSGKLHAEPVQASYWLQKHGFETGTYRSLVQGLQLNRRVLPYHAGFEVTDLEPFGARYRVYVAAENPSTFALSSTVLSSGVFITPLCPRNCADCGFAVKGECNECMRGAQLNDDNHCVRCTDHCDRCQEVAAKHSATAEDGLLCDMDSCALGYGRTHDGLCQRCGLDHCEECGEKTIKNNGTEEVVLPKERCDSCEAGFGIFKNGSSVECRPCSDPRCTCDVAGGCKACATGFGITPVHEEAGNASASAKSRRLHGFVCSPCDEGCEDCIFSSEHGGSCTSCKPGYVKSGGRCKSCPKHCESCNEDLQCLHCAEGFGMTTGFMASGDCVKCEVDHCMQCNSDQSVCKACRKDFGVTPGGNCESCGNYCLVCDVAGTCKSCADGYAVTHDGSCWSCADGCASCVEAGPNRCDKCRLNYELDDATKTCHWVGRRTVLSYDQEV